MKLYLVDPFGQRDLLADKLRDSPFHYLYEELEQAGIELRTYDKGDLAKADRVIFFNHNESLLARCKAAGKGKSDRVLVLWEPETVCPGQYSPKVWGEYGAVVTFREDLSRKYGLKRACYPQGQSLMPDFPGFAGRKFLTLINANKYSYVDGELYSLRRRAIEYFEKSAHMGFDLYGVGWNTNFFLRHPRGTVRHFFNAVKNGRAGEFLSDVLAAPFTRHGAYRGQIPDKYPVLAGYRFAICFENEASWFTEKLFDALSCGTIPVYKGPPEIKGLVPESCYIDYDRFSGFPELEAFMRGMRKEEFETIQGEIRSYMSGERFAELKPAAVFRELAVTLTEAAG